MTPFNTPLERAMWVLSDRDLSRIPLGDGNTKHLINEYSVYRTLQPSERIVVKWSRGRTSMKRCEVIEWLQRTGGNRPPYAKNELLPIREVSEIYGVTTSTIRSHIYNNPHLHDTHYIKIDRQWFMMSEQAHQIWKDYTPKNNGRLHPSP